MRQSCIAEYQCDALYYGQREASAEFLPFDQAQIDFENEGGETYICGNPPYLGKGKKSIDHLDDMDFILGRYTKKYGYVDYVGCWFIRAAEYIRNTKGSAALVATNFICDGVGSFRNFGRWY